MTIGERISNVRISKGFSLTELASIVDVSKQTLYKYEKGIVTNIPLNKIECIAKALNITPAYLMGWEDKDDNNKLVKSITVEHPSADENELITNYRKLNTSGKEKATEYVTDLTTMEKYIADDIKSKLG